MNCHSIHGMPGFPGFPGSPGMKGDAGLRETRETKVLQVQLVLPVQMVLLVHREIKVLQVQLVQQVLQVQLVLQELQPSMWEESPIPDGGPYPVPALWCILVELEELTGIFKVVALTTCACLMTQSMDCHTELECRDTVLCMEQNMNTHLCLVIRTEMFLCCLLCTEPNYFHHDSSKSELSQWLDQGILSVLPTIRIYPDLSGNS